MITYAILRAATGNNSTSVGARGLRYYAVSCVARWDYTMTLSDTGAGRTAAARSRGRATYGYTAASIGRRLFRGTPK